MARKSCRAKSATGFDKANTAPCMPFDDAERTVLAVNVAHRPDVYRE
jgi:hypothetical protein